MKELHGFVKLHRQMLEWEWYGDVMVKTVFLHLLLKANFKDVKWQGMEIKAGQVIVGSHQLAQELGLSRQQIRTALKKLQSSGEIMVKATSRFSVITLVNWDKFQRFEERATNQQPTINQPSTNQQPTINQPSTNQQPQRKNDKNGKNDKNDKEREERENVRTSKAETPPLSALMTSFDFPNPLADKIGEWVIYKEEMGSGYQEVGFKNLCMEIKKKEEQYGAEAIITLMGLCMSNGWRGIIWDRIISPTGGGQTQPTGADCFGQFNGMVL